MTRKRSGLRHWPLIMALALCLGLSVAAPSRAQDGSPLTLLHYWTGPLSGGIQDAIDSFNTENEGQQVRAKGDDHESFKAGIRFMLSAGTPPDLFSYWAGERVQSLVDLKHLAPIDDVWKNAGLAEKFSPAISQACTYDGKKYALPLTQHYVCLFYNASLFKKYNLKPPADWEQFLKVCDELRKAGVTPVALGAKEKWPAQFWFDYLLLRTAGNDYRSRLMTGRASYTDPEVERVFALWQSMVKAGYFNPDAGQLDWAEAAGLVRDGQAAMTLMGTWIIGLYDGQLSWNQTDDYDFFRFPTMDPAIPDTALGPVDVIVIPSEGRVQASKRVLAYFSAPGPQSAMSKGSGALAPSREVPPETYSPMQRRILKIVQNAPDWAFNYDLATPPTVAGYGLDLFKKFLINPKGYRELLADMDHKAYRFFTMRGPK